MKPQIDKLTPENIVSFIGSIFDRRGDEEYLGEPVNMGQHMLQGATIAEQNGQSEEIIVGALLHDIGHFTSEFGTFSMEDKEDRYHEDAGAAVLEHFFPIPIRCNIVEDTSKCFRLISQAVFVSGKFEHFYQIFLHFKFN